MVHCLAVNSHHWQGTQLLWGACALQDRYRCSCSAVMFRYLTATRGCAIGIMGPKVSQENIAHSITPPLHSGAIAFIGNWIIHARPSTWYTRNLESSDQATFSQSNQSTVQSRWSWAHLMCCRWWRAVSMGGHHCCSCWWFSLCSPLATHGWMKVCHLAIRAIILIRTHYSGPGTTHKTRCFRDSSSEAPSHHNLSFINQQLFPFWPWTLHWPKAVFRVVYIPLWELHLRHQSVTRCAHCFFTPLTDICSKKNSYFSVASLVNVSWFKDV